MTTTGYGPAGSAGNGPIDTTQVIDLEILAPSLCTGIPNYPLQVYKTGSIMLKEVYLKCKK